MAFMYFAASMLGIIIYGGIFSKQNTQKMYLLLRSILAIVVLITALQTNMFLFMLFYILIYLFFGMANIPESVILNKEIPNEFRASVLSLNSLILQIGALFGSFINSIIINYSTIPTLWFVASGGIITTILITYKKLMSVENKIAPKGI